MCVSATYIDPTEDRVKRPRCWVSAAGGILCGVRNPLPDSTVVARVRAGSADALGELYARHASALMTVAYRLTASAADAEDVLHDVFLGLPEALRRYDERGSLDAWLRRVTVRTALMRLRAGARRREVALDDLSPAPAAHVVDRLTIDDALRALPDSLRAVFVLKEVEGHSHAAIAELLGISVGASEVRLTRAMRQLRNLLRDSM